MYYDRLIGLPYKSNGRTLEGVDCWGLVYLFHGGKIPSYVDTYTDAEDGGQISSSILTNKKEWEKVETPDYGDVVVINIKGLPVHCGIYLDNNRILHTLAGHDSVVESLNSPKWASRIEGYYRWS